MATIKRLRDVMAAAGTVELSDAVFTNEPNVAQMHRNAKAQQASRRQGTANTRNRVMVCGGRAAVWRYSTGCTRQGTICASPVGRRRYRVHPHTCSYDQKVNKNEIKLAMRSALPLSLA
ncbi:MAG: 50S ribosomal protein L4 [Adlercreutzia equolifaciens]